jgi:transcriptional regulator with XRE-family HTH domain
MRRTINLKQKIMKRIKTLETITKIPVYLAADRGGFSRTTAAELLKGQANPTLLSLYKISSGFDKSLRYIFDDDMFGERVD